jgi:hypothetical protein
MKALGKQVSDLQAQISALPVGNVLSDEDKSALATAASDLDNSINTLQTDIPANTDLGNNAQSGGQIGSGGPGQSEQSADNIPANTDQGGDGAAQDGPQPLPGTGAA